MDNPANLAPRNTTTYSIGILTLENWQPVSSNLPSCITLSWNIVDTGM